MKQIIQIALTGLRCLTVALMLVALVLSGAGAAERLYAQQQETIEEPTADNASLDSQPDPNAPAGEMAHGGKPYTDQPCIWQAVAAIPGSGGQAKITNGHKAVFSVPTDGLARQVATDICSTLSRVDARVGHRFTLVGARPSGTS